MSVSNNHLIRSVRFDTETDIEANASVFADAVSAIDHQLLFGKVLDKYDGINEVVGFDKIELDLGSVDINDLDGLEAALIRLLDEALAENFPAVYSQSAMLKQSLFITDHEGKYADEDEPVVYTTKDKINILVRFFRTGTLPWNTPSPPDIERLLVEVIKAAPALVRQKLLPLFLSAEAVQRMAYSLSYEVCMQVLALYIESGEQAIIEKITGAVNQEMPGHQRTAFEQQLVIIYLKAIGGDSSVNIFLSDLVLAELKLALHERAHYITEATYHRVLLLLQQEEKITNQRVYRKLLLHVEELLIARGVWEPKKQQAFDNTIPEQETIDANEQIIANNTSIETDQLKKDHVPQEKEAFIEDAIDEGSWQQATFIDNSGLVLVASFLPGAFKKMGWVENGNIVDVIGRDKMLLWMDYLVWGARKTYEYNLSFNKVLAGMEPQEVVNSSLVLTDEERLVADSLLGSVIQHWSILKNTTIDGLRTSFLQRNGKICDEDGGWQLHVETKPFDMLIDKLPWSLSIIKFSWMEKPVYTQWRTKI